MGRMLDRLEQLAFAQLADLAQSDRSSRFPANGSFVKAKRGDTSYWYYSGYKRSVDGSAAARTRIYVGPVGDPEIERLRTEQETAHVRYRERRRIAASLRRAGLPAPTPFDGAVVDALSSAGVFDAGAILVGSTAFQTFSGLLGERLDDALMQTGDIDVARAPRVIVHLPELDAPRESLERLLKHIDPTFEPILDRAHPGRHLGYKNQRAYKIEFLTTEGRKRGSSLAMVELKDLDGVFAQPIAFLEYLIEQPTRSVLLHDDGISVVVPDPARYGVHKLIVAHMRERTAVTRGAEVSTRPKVAKDVAQAAALIEVLHRTQRDVDLAAAWEDAYRRGPSWRRHMAQGVLKLRPDACRQLEEIVLSHVGPAAWRGLPSSVPRAEDTSPSSQSGATDRRISKKARTRGRDAVASPG